MKIKVTVLATYEFEPDSNHYPDGWNDEQIISHENMVFNDDPSFIFSVNGNNATVSVEKIES